MDITPKPQGEASFRVADATGSWCVVSTYVTAEPLNRPDFS